MNPTTDTVFERFAFYSMVLYTVAVFVLFLIPFVPYAGLIFIFLFIFFLPYNILCTVKIERDHLEALTKAEQELSDVVISDLSRLPSNWEPSAAVFLMESVVLGNDYFKELCMVFRNWVGGESKGGTKLIERARREAAVRLLRKAKSAGMNVVWNVRYETIAISRGRDNKKFGGIAILIYGTCFAV